MNRFNSIVLAACIVAVSLIASALIMTHRPAAAATSSLPPAALTAKPAGTPPLAQASVTEQFRTQVLAAPELHICHYNGKTYTLADVKVGQVIYTAKDDDFNTSCEWVWQPAMPADGPQSSGCTLNNDGYGHYYGSIALDPGSADAKQNADITIR